MSLFKKSEVTINITTEAIMRVILLTVMAVIALRLVGSIGHQLRLIAISLFLAFALNPAVSWLTRRLRSGSRTMATGVAYIAVLTVLISFLSLVVPPLVKETTDFVRDIPKSIQNFKEQDTAVARFARRYNLDDRLDGLSNDLNNRLQSDFATPVFSAANRVLGTVISMVTVLVLTFMMLVEGPLWLQRIIAMQPADKRAKRKSILLRMYRVVTGYVNGQVLIAAIAAVVAMIALLIGGAVFDVSLNAIALAGIIFIFGLIPMIGNTLGAVIVVLFIVLNSAPFAAVMAVYFLLYQQIENATLQPYIQAKSNQLTPLVVFIAALLGAGIGGLLGALAAIPVAGCVRILFEERFPNLLPTTRSVEKHES